MEIDLARVWDWLYSVTTKRFKVLGVEPTKCSFTTTPFVFVLEAPEVIKDRFLELANGEDKDKATDYLEAIREDLEKQTGGAAEPHFNFKEMRLDVYLIAPMGGMEAERHD